MGIEYYIVKPFKKQIFYLGKHLNDLEGVPKAVYRQALDFVKWENPNDVIIDILQNCESFNVEDLTIRELKVFATALYEFCDDPVILDCDCSDTAEKWLRWEEIDYLSDL